MGVEAFISYSHRDQDDRLRSVLMTNLKVLQRQGLITTWHDRDISAGMEWKEQIDEHLRSAGVILLLISPDFLASDYCYDNEMKVALERHQRGDAVVIPIILRPCDLTDAPFMKLEALPAKAKPITLWSNEDEAFVSVVQGIRRAVSLLQKRALDPGMEVSTPVIDMEPGAEFVEGERVLDAAIARQVYVDRTTELLVLIRRTESGGLRAVVTEEPEIGIEPDQVRSKPFLMSWPLGDDGQPDSLRVGVRLDSPDFDPPQQSKVLVVPPFRDSEVCTFLLAPQKTGPLVVQVELSWEEALQTSRVLRTQCSAESAPTPDSGKTPMHVISVPLFAASLSAASLSAPSLSAASWSGTAAVAARAKADSFPRTASPATTVDRPRKDTRENWLSSKALATAALAVLMVGVAGTYSLLNLGGLGEPDTGPASIDSGPASVKRPATANGSQPPPVEVPTRTGRTTAATAERPGRRDPVVELPTRPATTAVAPQPAGEVRFQAAPRVTDGKLNLKVSWRCWGFRETSVYALQVDLGNQDAQFLPVSDARGDGTFSVSPPRSDQIDQVKVCLVMRPKAGDQTWRDIGCAQSPIVR
ncbi:MAG: toll/interleukin-1 receptor domain-containing protein [Bryobacteraceae bacterium]|nr:toll/interleukin-1 receptor domain-containing protein [Bryobacteraceae bacterium]